MLDVAKSRSARALPITDQDVEDRKRVVGLGRDDIARIMSLTNVIEPSVDRYADEFFDHVRKVGAAPELFARRSVLEEAKQRKRAHLLALVRGQYDRDYVEQRIELASLYSKCGMEARAFIGAFQHLMHSIGTDIVGRSENAQDAFQKFLSVAKVGSLDVSIITDVLIAERERTIGFQQQAIRELSTPVLQVRDRLLILPIIGVLDSERANQLTNHLLGAIRSCRCKFVVMDITGVAAVDSKVANHLIQTVSAARLMGSAVIITGLSAEIAQALVALGIDLGRIETTSDLQTGLEQAERGLGYRMVRMEEEAA